MAAKTATVMARVEPSVKEQAEAKADNSIPVSDAFVALKQK